MSTVKAVENIEQILIESRVDAGGAPAARDAILQALGQRDQGAPVALEFDAAAPTAPALQLMIASWRSLHARSAFGGFGPLAAEAMRMVRPGGGQTFESLD
jgi:hypothetical protein